MTTAPTPSRADALIREHRASMHAETLRAWASDAVDELGRLQAENERLRAERDEADRRAGAAERSAAAFHEDNQRFEQVRRRMKEQWGVHDNVSFDLVWQQALDAKQALAELEARKPLPLSDWINADERRPEAYLDVLVVIDGKWVTTGEWLHAQKTWCWEQTGDEPDESRVTHWMHMPSPPAHGITGGSS